MSLIGSTGNNLPPGAFYDTDAPWNTYEEQECDELEPDPDICTGCGELFEDCRCSERYADMEDYQELGIG